MCAMVSYRSGTCDKRKNASPVRFRVEPERAWTAVVLNRWRRLCPCCFDVEAEKQARYSFVDLDRMSQHDPEVVGGAAIPSGYEALTRGDAPGGKRTLDPLSPSTNIFRMEPPW